jgi:DNA-binding winged helix-turn-helix (wHTH) protein
VAGDPTLASTDSRQSSWTTAVQIAVADEVYCFGDFCLIPAKRLLLRADRPVRLGGRALDILVALVRRAGTVVPKRELIALVWPFVFVEDSNLRVNIANLRRALGDGEAGQRLIVSSAGQGYAFAGTVTRTGDRRRSIELGRVVI